MIAPLDKYWIDLIRAQVEGAEPPPVPPPNSVSSGNNHTVMFDAPAMLGGAVNIEDMPPGQYRTYYRGPKVEDREILRVINGQVPYPEGAEVIDMKRIR